VFEICVECAKNGHPQYRCLNTLRFVTVHTSESEGGALRERDIREWDQKRE